MCHRSCRAASADRCHPASETVSERLSAFVARQRPARSPRRSRTALAIAGWQPVPTNGRRPPLAGQPAEAAFFRHGNESAVPRRPCAMPPERITSSGAPVITSPPGISSQTTSARAQRQLEIVRRDDHGERTLLTRQPPEQSHQLHAGRDVEKRRRLVEHEQHRLLRQRTRHHHTLPLAVRHPAQVAIGEVRGARPRRSPRSTTS